MPLPASKVHDSMQLAASPFFPNGSQHAGTFTLIFRIRRLATKAILKEHRLTLMPQRFSQTTEPRTALYYTKGGIVTDTPAATGVGATLFVIQGHTGYWGVPGRTGAPTVDVVPTRFEEATLPVGTDVVPGQPLPGRSSLIDGAAAIKDLQDTLLAYFFPAGQTETRDVTTTQDLQLEFYNLTAPTSAQDPVGRVAWRIHPHRNLVDVSQDASKPFLYSYTLQFAALAPLTDVVEDIFVQQQAEPTSGLQTTQAQLAAAVQTPPAGTGAPLMDLASAVEAAIQAANPPTPPFLAQILGGPLQGLRSVTEAVRVATGGVNAITQAMVTWTQQELLGPLAVFMGGVADLTNAVTAFMGGITTTIRFPLYAARSVAHILDVPRHSVMTLRDTAKTLRHSLEEVVDPRSYSSIFAGLALSEGVNDQLTIVLNHEAPRTLPLGTLAGGPAIAAAIQDGVRTMVPDHAANAAAYRDFTAAYVDGQYRLASGTKGSSGGLVTVVTSADPELTPLDASTLLGLGVSNGGHEQAGSADANQAIALLCGVEQACTHLLAFPDYFADQLEAQDAALAALLPPGVTRPQIRGDQRMQQTRITPGDTLQGIGARVGVHWQTLALVNRLTYPYLIDGPTTLVRGRVSSADYWTLTDTDQSWPVNAYQGQVVQILAGPGAGQSRRVLRNTATHVVLETAWTVLPNDTSDYAVQSADNPIVRTGTVTSATARTLTNGSLALVPESQRGLTLVLTSGATAGERRQITSNDATTYTLDTAWDVVPPAGSLYVLLGPPPATLRQKVVGDLLSVPQPSAQARLPIRSRLQDVSAMTGRHLTTEDKLFGRDAVLIEGALVYDPARADLVTIAGLMNLRQALIHYINLPLGELEYAPGIGSYVQEELGLTATLPLQIQVLASLERTIKQDARIASMHGARLVTQGGFSVIAFGATAINGATVDRVLVR